MSAAANFLDTSVLRAINQPVADARALPREAYTDPVFLALERKHVFDASWVFAGTADSIPDPGDAMPNLYERDKADHGTLPMFPGFGEYWKSRAEYPSLMPNLLLGVHADHINVWGLYPIGTDRVLGRVHFFYAGDEAMTADMVPTREVVERNLHSINLEDVGVAEAMQRGRSSPGYVDARFSPYHEACVYSFERRIANAVGAGLGLA